MTTNLVRRRLLSRPHRLPARPLLGLAMSEFRALPAGSGVPHSSASRERSAHGQVAPAIGAAYSEIEHLLAGLACTFEGPATGPAEVVTVGNGYTTRLIVRRPTDPARFSGRVVIEPFNTSGGPDRDIVWSLVGTLLQANGDAWIGITHRTSSVKHLQEYDVERYAELDLSSNDLAWDVLRQLAELVRQGGDQSPLGDLDVSHLYLAGYSQSAADIATFAMSIGPIARTASGSPLFDGYFPAGSSGSLTPLASGRSRLPRFEAGAIGMVDVPVIQTETQTDVEGFEAVLSSGAVHTNSGSANHRRDDSDAPDQRYRLYELAGAPHQNSRPGCDGDGSSFPTSAFVRAALAHLFRWAERGVAPPRAPRIDLATFDTVSEAAVDRVRQRRRRSSLALRRRTDCAVRGPLRSRGAVQTRGAGDDIAARRAPVSLRRCRDVHLSVLGGPRCDDRSRFPARVGPRTDPRCGIGKGGRRLQLDPGLIDSAIGNGRSERANLTERCRPTCSISTSV